ncbi:MAG TPA: dTDP-4-dehydrorhamnose 3,5-epimerase [Kineosporiaceae bacterium]
MRALPGVLPGTVVFEPTREYPPRDEGICVVDAEVMTMAGVDPRSLVQDIQYRLPRGAVHGLTLRTDGGEGKLVRCVSGSVLDVAVDLRPVSSTYRLWMTLVLDDVEHRSVWLPPGLAHGFQALSEIAEVCMRSNRIRQAEHSAVLQYDDPDLAIPWPLPVQVLTERERTTPSLAVIEPMLCDWFGAVR